MFRFPACISLWSNTDHNCNDFVWPNPLSNRLYVWNSQRRVELRGRRKIRSQQPRPPSLRNLTPSRARTKNLLLLPRQQTKTFSALLNLRTDQLPRLQSAPLPLTRRLDVWQRVGQLQAPSCLVKFQIKGLNRRTWALNRKNMQAYVKLYLEWSKRYRHGLKPLK